MAEYKEIPGHPGYRVGDDGTVWSEWRSGFHGGRKPGEWKLMKPGRSGNCGHLAVCLRPKKCFNVHSLVLSTFKGLSPEGMECRHLDGNPKNNRLDNLKWGTRRENVADSVAHGTQAIGQRACRAKLKDTDIPTIVEMLVNGEKPREIAKQFGVSRFTITAVRDGKAWVHLTGIPRPANWAEVLESRERWRKARTKKRQGLSI